MDSTVIIFFLVFASQIFLLSILYLRKFVARVNWVAKNLPLADYPGLYPDGPGGYTPERASGAANIFLQINNGIAALGFIILAVVGGRGYDPSPLGGDEIFVFLFFMLQMVPWFIAELSMFRHVRRMREASEKSTRSTDLRPRRFSDYASPVWVVVAAATYVAWLVFYVTSDQDRSDMQVEYYSTLIGITAVNLMYVFVARRAIAGREKLPGQTRPDHDKTIRFVILTTLVGSIGCNLFLMLTQAADEYALELWDPVFTSLFFQIIVVFGMGNGYRSIKLEETDFGPWRGKQEAV